MSEIVTAILEAESILAENLRGIMEGTRYVDPMEPYRDTATGELWQPVGVGSMNGTLGMGESNAPYSNETEQTMIRKICRHFARENAFAIAAHESRVSYIVGSGHVYTAVDRDPDKPATEEQKGKVQQVVEEFMKLNRWQARQQENVLRNDRDGEVLLRIFDNADGIPRIRYVEPIALQTPEGQKENLAFRYGIEYEQFDEGGFDFETPVRYHLTDGKIVEEVDAKKIQHRTRGPMDAVRGIPLLWPCRKHLDRALKILKNGSTITEIQTAIAMIRKFTNATRTTVKTWLEDQSDKINPPAAGEETDGEVDGLVDRYGAGTIINAPGNVDYEMPGMKLNPEKYIASLQAELRAIAAMIVQAEFMLTAKTDDSSRAAAFAAESPSVRNFDRLQWAEIEWDLELLDYVLESAVESNLLTQDDIEDTKIDVRPPELEIRDKAAESARRREDVKAELLSVETARSEAGYNNDVEDANIAARKEASGGLPTGERPDDFLKNDKKKDEDAEDDDEPDNE